MEFNKNFFEKANLKGNTSYDEFYDFFVYSKLLDSEEDIKARKGIYNRRIKGKAKKEI